MPNHIHGVLLHTMSGTELSRVRTELRLLPEPNNQRLLMSRGADIVMQSSDLDALAPGRCGPLPEHHHLSHSFGGRPYVHLCKS